MADTKDGAHLGRAELDVTPEVWQLPFSTRFVALLTLPATVRGSMTFLNPLFYPTGLRF